MSKLAEYLNQHILGNVFDGQTVRKTYSTDRSILQMTPRLVALPETTNDIRKLLRFSSQLASRDFKLPVTVRGSGLDKTGASLGPGLVISTEKLNHIEEIDVRGRLVRVQPGITLGALNEALRLQGMCLPIVYDPRATLGGLIANCPNDDASERYGGIFHFVERLEVVLPNGDLVQLSPQNYRAVELKTASALPEGELYRKIEHIVDESADTILDCAMRPLDLVGYRGITQVRTGRGLNLLPLMFGSQGTLAVISDIILHVETLPPEPERLLVSFHDLKAAQRFLNYVRDLEPFLLKIYDLRIIEAAAESGKKPDLFTRKLGKGLLVIVSFNYRHARNRKKFTQCLNVLPPGTFSVLETPDNGGAFDSLYNSLLSYLNDDGHGQHAPVMDDVFVPSMHFGDFLDGLHALEEELKIDLPLFGSFATSSYNVRPRLDCTTIEGRKQIINFLKRYSQLVLDCQGSLTGNGPEGQVKALMLPKTLGVGERQLYTSIKQAFDPLDILNPHVKLGADIKNIIRHLRTTEKDDIITP